MAECNSIEAPDIYPNLNDQQQLILHKVKSKTILLQILTKEN